MKSVFIDTNTWLSLYYFTNNNLLHFEKFENMTGSSINLKILQQVYMKQVEMIYLNNTVNIR